jgi:hypothetical protein
LNGDRFNEFSISDIIDMGEMDREEIVRDSYINKIMSIDIIDDEIDNERFFQL